MLARLLANARVMLAQGGRFLICSVPWKAARGSYHLQAPSGRFRQYLRGARLLALSHFGVNRLGHWYSFGDFHRLAHLNGFEWASSAAGTIRTGFTRSSVQSALPEFVTKRPWTQ